MESCHEPVAQRVRHEHARECQDSDVEREPDEGERDPVDEGLIAIGSRMTRVRSESTDAVGRARMALATCADQSGASATIVIARISNARNRYSHRPTQDHWKDAAFS